MDQTEKILALLAQHPTAVLATADTSGNPAAAPILFAEDHDLSLIFGTHPTRKFENLKANPKAALAMVRDLQAIQYHGYTEVLSGDAAEAAGQLFMKKHPSMSQQLVEGSVFFRIHPTWIRYIDMASQPWEQFELRFPEPDWFHGK